jgi:hypothetical protein
LLLQYKNDIEVFKTELNMMRNKITIANEETKNTMFPASESLLRQLMMTVTIQKDENNREQANVTQIKKEFY